MKGVYDEFSLDWPSLPGISIDHPYLQVRERVAHAHGQREGGPVGFEGQEAVQLQQVAFQGREAPVPRGGGALRCVCVSFFGGFIIYHPIGPSIHPVYMYLTNQHPHRALRCAHL